MTSSANNIHLTYAKLHQQVNVALHTQVGDAICLQDVRSQVLVLCSASNQVSIIHAPITIVSYLHTAS